MSTCLLLQWMSFLSNSYVTLSWATCSVSIHCILQSISKSISKSVFKLQRCHFALKKSLKKDNVHDLETIKQKMAHMTIKANHEHFRKAYLVLVLCFTVCRTCIMKSDIGAYIPYYLVNWKDWDDKWLAEFFPSAIPCLSGRLCPWFEIFMLANTKEQASLSGGWVQRSL